MEDSTPKPDQHMTVEVFEKALNMTRRVEQMAWDMGCQPWILLSGGECTEHPQILDFIERTERRGWSVLLITNGSWLHDEHLRKEILRPGRNVQCQITHDPRFYPMAPPPQVHDPRVTYVGTLTALIPLGRALRKKDISSKGVPMKAAPGSFNLRSFARSMGSIQKAVAMLRMRFMQGKSGACIPSVTHEGFVMAGETRSCFKIGDVDSGNEDLTSALISMRCNHCGLEDNLSPEQKQAIGAL